MTEQKNDDREVKSTTEFHKTVEEEKERKNWYKLLITFRMYTILSALF